MRKFYPSLLAAPALNMRDAICELETSNLFDAWHIDIMDGNFVPNFGLSFASVRELSLFSRHPLHVHMMVVDPLKTIERFLDLGVELIFLHPETVSSFSVLERLSKKYNCQIGFAISPNIQRIPDKLREFSKHLLLMGVVPGFAGQEFISDVLDKVPALKAAGFDITLDGGVKLELMPMFSEIKKFVLGNALFKDAPYLAKLEEFTKC